MNDCQLGSCKASLESLFSHLTEKDLNRTVTTILLRLAIISAFDLDYYFSQSWGDFVKKSQELGEVSKSPLFDDRLLSWLVSPVSKSLSDKIIKEVSEKVSEAVRISENKLWEVGSIHEGLINSKDKRKSGSHYTPVKLAREVVEEAFRPWLESHKNNPPVDAVLDLKVCDPAVGCGVFLLETTDFLDSYIKDKVIGSKRRIIENCLYGVDIGWFPVEITKVCLWLKAEDSSFNTEHLRNNIQQGDSLVGVSTSEIRDELESVRGSGKNYSTAYLKVVGDLLVAAHFNGRNKSDRAAKKKIYLALTTDCDSADELEEVMAEPLQALRHGEKGIQPLHWPLAFPDVFRRENPGFDVFVGNPPFAGKNTTAEAYLAGILDWFKVIHKESHGNADLVAHFFRRCFDLLRINGILGLIATNTIAQGDTRSTGLRWICLHGGTIYSARKRYKWPGVAAVVVSVVHLRKGSYTGEKRLDGQLVPQITAFLFVNGGHENPRSLKANKDKCFQGSILLGMGFTFDDSGPADDDTPGIPSPIATMERLIAEKPKNAEVIFPYIGGEEVNSSPTHAHHRYVINFGTRSEDECRNAWPELMRIIERKVMDERLSKSEEVAKYPWWHHWRPRPELYAAIAGCERVLVISRVGNSVSYAFMKPKSVFAESLVVFPFELMAFLSLLQGRIHEWWARFLASSMKDDLRYSPSDCFETFPFPTALLDSATSDPTHDATRQSLEAIGKRYHQFRAELMVTNNEGLTKTYNRFHDPEVTSEGILKLRRLHSEMDQAVLNAYGWSDVPTACGYGLDYLDTEDDAELPEHLQDRIDSGDLFFWDAGEALDFQGQLRASGAVKGKKRLPWRYRWPDAVRDDVLARLLALNAERYAEEVAQGLHPPRKRATITG